jgi:hypothetical protein
MSCLSIKLEEEDGPKALVVCANPIYLLSDFNPHVDDEIEFEVLDSDATQLKTLVGTTRIFGLEGKAFTAEVTKLKPRVSTVDALMLMRHMPAMRGTLTIKSLTP